MDIFQTIIELVDVKLPDDRLYDGINLVPFILGEKESNPHEYLYWQRGFSKAIRNNEWKLSINGESQDSVLFHISSDPYEAFDLFENNKEIARQLARAHEEWSWQLPPPLWPSMIYYHFQDGDKRYYFDQ
jgi:arylsulfatase A-like enzyme